MEGQENTIYRRLHTEGDNTSISTMTRARTMARFSGYELLARHFDISEYQSLYFISSPFAFSFECGSGDELNPHIPDTYFKLQGNSYRDLSRQS